MKFLNFSLHILIMIFLINCAESPEQYKESVISEYKVEKAPEIGYFNFKASNPNSSEDHVLASHPEEKNTEHVLIDYSRKQGLHLDSSIEQIQKELSSKPLAVQFKLDQKVTVFKEGLVIIQDKKTKKINQIHFLQPFKGALSSEQKRLEIKIGKSAFEIAPMPTAHFSPENITQLIFNEFYPEEKINCFKQGKCFVNFSGQGGLVLEIPHLKIFLDPYLKVAGFYLDRKDYLKSEVKFLDLGNYVLKTKNHSFKLNEQLDQKTKGFLKPQSSMEDFSYLSSFKFMIADKNYGSFFVKFKDEIEEMNFHQIPSLAIYGKKIYLKQPYLRVTESKESLKDLFSLNPSDDSYKVLNQDQLEYFYNKVQDKNFRLEFSKQLSQLVFQEWKKNENTDQKSLHKFTHHNISLDEQSDKVESQFFYHQSLFYNEKTEVIKELHLMWGYKPILPEGRAFAKHQNHLQIKIKSFKDPLLGAFLSQKDYANFVYNGSLPLKLSPSLEKTFKSVFKEIQKGTGVSVNKIQLPIQIIGPVFFTPAFYNSLKLPSGTKAIFQIKNRISSNSGLGEVYLAEKKSKAKIILSHSLNLSLPDLKRSILSGLDEGNVIANVDKPLAYKEESIRVLSAQTDYLQLHISYNPHSSSHKVNDNTFSGNLLAVDYLSYHMPQIDICFSGIKAKSNVSKKDFMKKIQDKEAEIEVLTRSFKEDADLALHLIQNYSSTFHLSYFFFDRENLFKKLSKRVQEKIGFYREFHLEDLSQETEYIAYQTAFLPLIGSNIKDQVKRKNFQDQAAQINSINFKNKFLKYYALSKKDLREISKEFKEVPSYLINALATYIKTQKQIENSSNLYFFAKADFKNKKRVLKDILNYYTCQYSVKDHSDSYSINFPYQGLALQFSKNSGLESLRVFNLFYLDEKE